MSDSAKVILDMMEQTEVDLVELLGEYMARHPNCRNCGKVDGAEIPHACPFKEEIHGDSDTLCMCCDAMDI